MSGETVLVTDELLDAMPKGYRINAMRHRGHEITVEHAVRLRIVEPRDDRPSEAVETAKPEKAVRKGARKA